MREQRGGHPLADLRPGDHGRGPRRAARRGRRRLPRRDPRAVDRRARRATRQVEGVEIGASVRGTLALDKTARAWALLHGRDFVTSDDLEQLFLPVLGHRLILTPSFLAETRMQSRDEALGQHPRPLPRAWHRGPSPTGTSERTAPRAVDGCSETARRAFPLVPRWRVAGIPFGEQRSLRRGPGSDVAGSREYGPGDPVSRSTGTRRRASRLRAAATCSSSARTTPRRHRASSSLRPAAAMSLYPPPAPLALEAAPRSRRSQTRSSSARSPRAARSGTSTLGAKARGRAVLAPAEQPTAPLGGRGAARRGASSTRPRTASSAGSSTSHGCAPTCRRAASSSSSRTSSRRRGSSPGCACARSAGTSSR